MRISPPASRCLPCCGTGTAASVHHPIAPQQPFTVDACPDLQFTAVPIASNAPPYSPYRDRPLPGHNVALFIENRRNGQTLFYAPGLGEPDETLLPWLQKRTVC